MGRGGEGDGFDQTFAVKSLRGLIRGKRPLSLAAAAAQTIST